MTLLGLLEEYIDERKPDKIYGVVTGIVRDIRDPLGQGRVKVDFPWLAEEADTVTMESKEDRAHSFWARIASLMAGKKRGSYFIPEVDDEVLVAFEHGDRSRPIVLGGLWNEDDEPPERMDRDGQNNRRLFESRSGHRFEFDDDMEGNKAKITVESQGGHKLVLDDSDDGTKIEMSTTDGRKISLHDTDGLVKVADPSGNELTMDANANTVTIKSAGDMEGTAGGNLTIKVTGSAKIQASAGVTIDSSDIKLGASASLTLVNDTFLTLFNAHTHVGLLGVPTTPPLVPALKNVQSTIFTKGA